MTEGPIKRPKAPEHLGEIATELWNNIVADNVADYFPRETLPLLEQYCLSYERSRIYQSRHDAILAESEDGQGIDYKGLELFRDMIAKESNVMKSNATALRLTQHSRYTPRKGKTAVAPGENPLNWNPDNK